MSSHTLLLKKIEWCFNGKNMFRTKREEDEWGNRMIGKNSNNFWTSKFGEELFKEVMELHNINIRRSEKINCYIPDFECDNFLYEIKTRKWFSSSGTIGEKVFSVPYKYSELPRITNKKLKIVCIGRQEYDLTFGNTRIFCDNLCQEKKNMLLYWKENNIEFVKFSDLVNSIIYKIN